MDPEKAAKASAGGSSRGSAQFLSEVEGQRAIKVCAWHLCSSDTLLTMDVMLQAHQCKVSLSCQAS